MTPGPKPKPAEVREKLGNPSHRPMPKTADDGAPVDASVPQWLDDDGRAIWNNYVPRLKHMGFFRGTDREAFARLCDHTARWRRLRDKVNAVGESYVTTSAHGTMQRINPDFRAMLAVEEKMVSLEDRFGLTPASRQQVLARMREPTMPAGVPENAQGTTAPAEFTGSPLGIFAPRTSQAATH